jgi:hypothetical protein
MCGQGKIVRPDGSWYEGQWKNSKFDGPGLFSDSNGVIWEGKASGSNLIGIFDDGKYDSKIQKRLKAEQELKDRLKVVGEKSKVFFEKFFEAFAKSDKKTMAGNLAPFFPNADNSGEYLADPYPKYEERAPEKWNEAFHAMIEAPNLEIRALLKAADSHIIEAERILAPQLGGKSLLLSLETAGGQLVELKRVDDDKTVEMVLLELADGGNWLIAYFGEKANA